MKPIIRTIFVSLLCCSEAFAQNVLLPYSEAWNAKCYYAKSGDAMPDADWFEAEFDDSTWDDITGPIYRSKGLWADNYSTYWLRRHFTLDEVDKFHEYVFYVIHDDGCTAYLNGQLIYSNSGVVGSYNPISLYLSTISKLRKGDNVLSVRVSDSGGGDAFINYGLCAYEEPQKYTELRSALDSLQQCINSSVNNPLPNTILEATRLLSDFRLDMNNYKYSNEEAVEKCNVINTLITRLGYNSIDVTVSVPGSMGDSILAKVENFSDVVSLKVSGKLNDADLYTIQSRLSNLHEIDMTDVKIESIPDRFFYQHHNLQKVFLPKTLMTIGEHAFYQCYGLNYVEFPTTLTTINKYGFSECDNIQEVTLHEGFSILGEGAFYSCDNNKYVKLPGTLSSISSIAFYNNLNLRNVVFAEGLTHIYNDAFGMCNTLNNLRFPTSLYYIGVSAFSYNHSLSNIEFNEGLYQIDDNAFYDCDALMEVTLPSSLVLANASPFDYCDNLVKVTCLSIEPPYMTDQIPYGLGMSGRELYVPALSINAYKQTSGWDKFPTIKPIDYLPENINVVGDLKLTLPENIPTDYKPNVSIIHDLKGTSYWQYGSLTVNGEGTLSISDFSIFWDPNYQYIQYNRTQNHCSLVNNSHLRADNVRIDVWPRNNIWTFLTLPFDVKVSEILPFSEGTTNWVIRKYDGQKRANNETSNTWVKMTADDVLNAYEGFIIQGSRYIGNNSTEGSGFSMKAINNSNKNNIFRADDVVVTLNEYPSEFAHNRSWNLVGNPYPCYYDTRFMDFEAPITVWNMRNDTYEAYSPVDDSYILCPGEAFFVQCPINKDNIAFSKDGRQTNRDIRAIEVPVRTNVRRANTSNAPRTIVNLSITNGNDTDRTRIVLNNDASMQYEMDKDACKFMSTDAAVPQIFTLGESVNYAINERPLADGKINLCTYIGIEGLYTIELLNKVKGFNVVLEDKALNKNVILNGENGYTFFAGAGTYTSRFVIHFYNETTSIENTPTNVKEKAVIYSIEGVKMATPTKKGIYIQNGNKIMLYK